MRSPQRIAGRFVASALSAEPTFVRADHLPAVGAVLQVRRLGRLDHLARLALRERFVNTADC